MRLHWHRRDLRLADNRGLAEPTSKPVGVFVFDDSILEYAGAPRVAFLCEAIDALQTAYRTRDSELFVRRGDPAEWIPSLVHSLDADEVSWNLDYSGLSTERDDRVRDALDPDRSIRTAHDAVCHEPGSITTADGNPYSVYSYFWKKWRDREKTEPFEIPDLAPVGSGGIGTIPAGEIPGPKDLGFQAPEASIPTAQPDAARDALTSFLDTDVFRYADRRDYPADRCTSRLSPHLKFGTIGIRDVDERVRDVRDRSEGGDRESVVEFRSQLAWREFYMHVLSFNPETVVENFREYENDLDWENDLELLAAWKRGETGYPIIDAGMRQLATEAFLHNRLRMIVASFLVKDLLVDWRYGYDYFRTHLVDHDTANDVGGWQWAASTGTDAQPYFRIFNPVTQGERYDPAATYVTRYVPELDGVDPEVVHSWTELQPTRRRNVAPDYPPPIVDHVERRERALEMFDRARGESG
ncbi:MAG: cryptochrome/photolyase family protein [Natronomonas sp.]